MSLASRKLIQATAGATTVDTGDDDFANVVLLLDGDGTSGDANNTFTDSSTNGFTVTESGSVLQGSFSPYGDNWSNYFGAAQSVVASDSAIAMGSGDWTLELWVYFNAVNNGTVKYLFDWRTGADTSNSFLAQESNSSWTYYNASGSDISSGLTSSTFNVGTWHHVALSRNGSTLRFFVDGTNVGSPTDSTTYDSSTITIGNRYTGSYGLDGYISNVRVVKGTALYTSAFTPPTDPLTAITNTQLLTCQSNRFVDESTNNSAITLGGTPQVTPFSPFKNDDARDITTDGGSANFDSSEYLTIADNASLDVSGAMTAEIWVYFTDMPDANIGSVGSGYLFNRWTASGSQRSWGIFVGANGAVSFYVSNSGSSSYTISSAAAGSVGLYRWHHVAVSWDGSNQRLFIDGDLKATTANTSGPFSTSSAGVTVNSLNVNVTGTNMNAYYSDARYFASAAVYTSSFTPPTAPIGTTNFSGSAYSINSLSYENKSFDVGSQESNPQGVRFKSDGTKMFVVGNTGDDVNEYDLSTAWDVSTATYSQNFSVASQDTIPTGVDFSPDGTKMYISGNSNRKLFQYTLSTAWDLSTASYASKSIASHSNSVGDVFIRPDGTSIYEVNNVADVVNQYDMTTAFDLSTASYTAQISISSQETIPTALTFSADGTKMLVAGQAGDDINQYTLSTAWSVSTATFDNNPFSTTSQAGNPAGITFKDDGTKLYMVSNASDTVYQYSVFLTESVLLNFQDAGIYDRSGINNLDTVGNAQIDTAVKKYGTGSMQFDGSGDYLEASYVSDLFDFDTADWTMECWVYLQTDSDSRGGIIEIYTDDSNYIRLFRDAGPDIQLRGVSGGTTQFDIQSSAQSQDTWIHVAGVRDGSTIRLFVDGTQVGTDTSFSIPDLSDARVLVGLDLAGTDRYFTGYIDDLRITKGIARYTSDFTPPTAALPKF